MAVTNDKTVLQYRERAKGNPLRSIRAMCVECMGGQPYLVSDCAEGDCPLYDYRMGKNPFHWKNKKRKTV